MTYIGSNIVTAQFVNDVFSGTGTQTAFTLSLAPYSINSILVMVGNQVMNPNTYSLNGAILTFATAPASGTNNISVRHLGVPAIPFTVAGNSISTSQLSATGTASSTTTLRGDNSWAPTLVGGNRIINGAMLLDTRNNGTAITPTTSGTYCLDRWATFGSQPSKFTVQQLSSSSVQGHIYYLAGSSTSAYTIGGSEVFGIAQVIEGFNISDLAWGNSLAKACTLTFWARASLTGTYGIFLKNGGVNVSGYSNYYYVTSYTINNANTWEQKVINITAPTSGQWEGTNGAGLCIVWSYGAGATVSGGTPNTWSSTFYAQPSGCVNLVANNGATLHITGVDFRIGTFTTAPQWEARLYGQELALCQRYYERLGGSYFFLICPTGYTAVMAGTWRFTLPKRANPTVNYIGAGFSNIIDIYGSGPVTPTTSEVGNVSQFDARVAFRGISPALTAGSYGGLTQPNSFEAVSEL